MAPVFYGPGGESIRVEGDTLISIQKPGYLEKNYSMNVAVPKDKITPESEIKLRDWITRAILQSIESIGEDLTYENSDGLTMELKGFGFVNLENYIRTLSLIPPMEEGD